MAELTRPYKGVCVGCQKQLNYGDKVYFFFENVPLGLFAVSKYEKENYPNSFSQQVNEKRMGKTIPDYGVHCQTAAHLEKGYICYDCWMQFLDKVAKVF